MADIYGGLLLPGPEYTVSRGEICSGATVLSGASAHIATGGQLFGGRILDGGAIRLDSGALISGQPVIAGRLSGGTVTGAFSVAVVNSGGTAQDVKATSFGGIYVSSGGVARNPEALAGGTIYVYTGGVASGAIVNSKGFCALWEGGRAVDVSVRSGASMSVLANASAKNVTIEGGGTFAVNGSAAVTTDAVVKSGGTLNVNLGTLSGGVFEQGSTLLMKEGARITGAASFAGYTSGGAVSGTGNTVHLLAGGSSVDLNVTQSGAAYIYGGTLSGGSVDAGGTVFLEDGLVQGVSASGGGLINVNGQTASAVGAIIASGGTMRAAMGGKIVSAQIASGGSLSLLQGATASQTTIGAAGQVSVDSGAIFDGGQILQGGTVSVAAGGQLTGSSVVQGTLRGGVLSGAANSIDVSGGGLAQGVTLTDSARMSVAAGGTASQTNVASGALLAVASGGTTFAATIGTGGSLQVDAGGRIVGLITLGVGARATVDTQAGGTINLADDNLASITITGSGDPQIVITGFNGAASSSSDRIVLSGVQRDQITGVTYPDADHVVLQMRDGTSMTLHIIGVRDQGYALSAAADGSTVYATCFLAGSMIRTSAGLVAVEEIRPGTVVQTLDHGTISGQRVTMTGHGHMQVNTALPDADAGYPVRIARGSLGDTVPNADLLVTPEHCLFIDGGFIPARMLVNGVTITYDRSITAYDYFHIATEKHAVIEANNLLTESYLDTGNRALFSDIAGDAETPAGRCWSEDAAAPLMTDRARVEPIWRAIMERAQVQPVSCALTDEADLALIDERGQSYRPYRRAGNRVLFRVPSAGGAWNLCSRSARPSEVIGPFVDDRRQLGVLVGRIMVHGARGMADVTAHLTDRDLAGWHEPTDGAARWTNGNARLVLDASAPEHTAILSIEIVAAGPYPALVQTSLSDILQDSALCA